LSSYLNPTHRRNLMPNNNFS